MIISIADIARHLNRSGIFVDIHWIFHWIFCWALVPYKLLDLLKKTDVGGAAIDHLAILFRAHGRGSDPIILCSTF